MSSDAPATTLPREELASPSNQDSLSLPPQMTSPSAQPSTRARPLSHASRSRMSQYSTSSIPTRSRPASHAFPIFPAQLPCPLVRDFAYGPAHPLHHGPPPEPSGPPSGMTTPASEHKRFSDPPMVWDSWTVDGFNKGHNIPPIQPGDGPPYSEDEDLQSPVVSTRHRKHKSTSAALSGHAYGAERGYFLDAAADGGERYYGDHGHGGEYVGYPAGEVRHSRAYHFSQQPQHGFEAPGGDGSLSSPAFDGADESRYSRDYQFTITSPDEEFHGKAVALFDFARENENELPLVEGQVIWVSYRHGQGWLVAEDPKTQESGLVPEEYVRLLRDIEGGMTSLTGQVGDGFGSPNDVSTPTQPEHTGQSPPLQSQGNGANGYHQPVLSVFSTSSKDLNPYPTGQLGLSTGQAPPQVVHYHGQRGGSQANTPTLAQHEGIGRRESQDTGSQKDATGPVTER